MKYEIEMLKHALVNFCMYAYMCDCVCLIMNVLNMVFTSDPVKALDCRSDEDSACRFNSRHGRNSFFFF